MTEQRRIQANSNTKKDKQKFWDRQPWNVKLALFSFALLDLVISKIVREVSACLESQFGGPRRPRNR